MAPEIKGIIIFAAMAIEIRVGILWEPEQMLRGKSYFSLLTVTKRDGIPSFRQDALSKKNIEKLSGQWSASIIQLLEACSVEENAKLESAILKQQQKMGKSAAAEALFRKALDKHRYAQVLLMLSKNRSLIFYHRLTDHKTKKTMTAACRLEQEQPALSFEIAGTKEQIQLKTLVHLNGQNLDMTVLQRFGCMLRHDASWYVMRLQDAAILDWLEAQQPEKYAAEPALFAEKILTKLEENHTVEKHDLFRSTLVQSLPACSIYLSELSNAFLMLTPRWNYEGFVVDGSWQATEHKTLKGLDYTIQRDADTENRFIQYIERLHPDFPQQSVRGFYFLSFANAKKKQWFIKAYRDLLDHNVEIVGLDMLQHFRYSPFDAAIAVELRQQTATQVELHVKVSFGKEEIPLLNVQKMLLAGQRNVLLKDDSIAVFSDEWMQQYALLFKHAVIYKNRMTLPPWVFLGKEPILGDEKNDSFDNIIPSAWQQQWFRWQQNEHLFDVPSSIQTILRPYQQKGFEWMVLLSQIAAGACLADDMGLGKTLQTICFIAYQHEHFPGKKSLVICPASLIYNWEQEIQKFAPALQPFIYNGYGRKLGDFWESGQQVLIASYNIIRQDAQLLREYVWQVAVIDESHNIKNPTAQITKAVSELSASNRVALSGTPVMNNTFDLYAQLQFLLPGLLGNREFFKKEYAHPIDRDGSEEKTNALRQLTAPFILRRTKKQVATDLPEKTETILWCEMSEEQQAFYEEVKADIQDSIFLGVKNEGLERSKLNILQGLQRLRQICDSPQLIKDAGSYTPCLQAVKIDRLLEDLQRLRLDGGKALVFSQYTGMLDLIAARCQVENIPYYHFDGSTAVEQRRDLVQQFQQEDDNATAFLISLKSGNAGLNLTSAQYVYLVDPWWNSAVEQQAIDRTHRIGQQNNVFAYRMICKNTIEEKIISLQQKKRQLSEELVGAEEGLVKNLSEDDLRYLFS